MYSIIHPFFSPHCICCLLPHLPPVSACFPLVYELRTDTVVKWGCVSELHRKFISSSDVGRPKLWLLKHFFHGVMSNGCVMLDENNLFWVSCPSCYQLCVCTPLCVYVCVCVSACTRRSHQAICTGIYALKCSWKIFLYIHLNVWTCVVFVRTTFMDEISEPAPNVRREALKMMEWWNEMTRKHMQSEMHKFSYPHIHKPVQYSAVSEKHKLHKGSLAEAETHWSQVWWLCPCSSDNSASAACH